ncbi:MAG: peptidoglycan-binding protein [bacterium]|nr:peptidoglycan-binding protein [bacterium]
MMKIKLEGGVGLKAKLLTVATTIALSGVVAFVPMAAVAQSSSDTIAQLQAQIAALSAQLVALSGGSAAPVVASGAKCSFTRNLKVGVKGDDVKCLQQYLNGAGYAVSASGAGSPGKESTYFGNATKMAVSKWQAAMSVSPAVGFFGALSRAKFDSTVVAAPVAPAAPAVPGTPAVAVPAGSGLTVTTVADQPAAQLAPLKASRLPFVKAIFTASSDGDVTVKSVTVERQGMADDDAFDSIVLLDEGNVQIGLSKTLNTLHQVLLNESFVVKAGTSKVMTIGANMLSAAGTTNSGQVAKLSIVKVDAGTTAVNGAFPIVGNGMTINESLDIGALASPSRGTLDPGSARSSLEVGTKAFYASGGRWSVGSQEPVLLDQMRWYQSGSAGSGDLKNVMVVVKDKDYPTEVSSDGKFYTAKFNPAIEFDKGATMEISIKTDIESGSDRTVDFDVQKRTDIVVKGKTFGYYIIAANGTSDPTDDTGAFSNVEPYYDAYQHTISKGSLRFEKNNAVSAGNVPIDVNGVELGAFGLEAKGEAVQISSFKVTFTLSAGEDGTQMDNVAIYDSKGAVVAGPKDVGSDETVTFTDTWTVPIGYNIYKLKGKLTTDFEDADTLSGAVDPDGDITAKGETTGLTLTASPATSQSMNTMTVRGASLKVSVAGTPSSQNVVRGITGFTFAKIQYDATNSGEDVKVTSQELTTSAGNLAIGNNLNTCQMFDGATALNTGSNIVNFAGTDSDAADEDAEDTFTLDNNLIIPKGTVKTVDVKCNIGSNAVGSGTYVIMLSDHDTTTTASADTVTTGKDTGVSITETVVASAGPVMTIQTGGELRVSKDISSPTARHGIAGKTDVVLAILKLESDYEALKLDRLALTLSSSTASTTDLSKVTLWDGATKVGEAVFTGTDTRATSTLTADFIVPKDSYKLLTIKGDLATLGLNLPGTRGALVGVNYDGEATTTTRATGQASGIQVNPANGKDTVADGVRLVRTLPTLERLAVPSNTLSNGTMTMFRFKVTADAAGDVGLYKFTFIVSSSSLTGTSSNFSLYGYSDSSFSVNAYASNPLNSNDVDCVGSSSVELGSDTNDTCTADNQTSTLTSQSASTSEVVIYFDPVKNTGANPTAEAINIPAGQSRYFELRGIFSSTVAGESISVNLGGDAGLDVDTNLVGRVTADTVDKDVATNYDNFIWSPNTTTTVATTTNDWINGYLLPGLPTTGMSSQTFSK